MRLLKTDTIEIQTFEYGHVPPYAILSHRWGKDELTYQDLEAGTRANERKEGFKKVQQCCSKAKADGFEYVWIDTCCIDKTSSAELSEAINSMYLWYHQAERCYAYLADISLISKFKESEWFTRGWTLQELLAPSDIYFLDAKWKNIGTKKERKHEISKFTGIPAKILCGDDDIETASIAQRMSWASNRETQRLEDRAYCLMGIFGIHMPLIYGEGEQAFLRLQEEIMKISHDDSLFAWKSSDSRGGLLATSPKAFEESGNIIPFNPFNDHNAALTINSRGVHLRVHFIGVGPQKLGLAILHCKRKLEKDPLAIYARDLFGTMETFERVMSEKLEQFDQRRYRPSQYPMRMIYIETGKVTPVLKSNNSKKWKRDNNTPYEIYDDFMLRGLMNFEDLAAVSNAARSKSGDHIWLLLTRDNAKVNWSDDYDWTALHHAVNRNNKALVEMLLARGADINYVNTVGETPILLAAKFGYEEILKLLIDAGAWIGLTGPEYRKPLSFAIMNSHRDTVKLLLENGAEVNEEDDSIGKNPLSLAASNADQRILQLLLEHKVKAYAEDHKIIRAPLLSAILHGHQDIVSLLLRKRTSVAAKDYDYSATTPLILAVLIGRQRIVKLLLENGAKIDEMYNDILPPLSLLSLAISNGHYSVAQLLLENGAKADAKADNSGRMPLSLAILNRHRDIVKLLLKYGAEADMRDDFGRTPLSLAIFDKQEDIVMVLLKSGAEVNLKDGYGATPLQVAALNGHENIVKLLLASGADINVQDNSGRTPLMLAATCGYGNIVILLLKWGACVNIKDNFDQTALFLAITYGYDHIVKLLLQDRADVHLKDFDGLTPLMLAKHYGHSGIINLLQEAEKIMANMT